MVSRPPRPQGRPATRRPQIRERCAAGSDRFPSIGSDNVLLGDGTPLSFNKQSQGNTPIQGSEVIAFWSLYEVCDGDRGTGAIAAG